MQQFIWKSLLSLFVKVNLTTIFKNHATSLKRIQKNGTEGYSFQDIFVFFLLPISLGCAAFFHASCMDVEAYSSAISVFSIFGALLFSAQVAMFGLLRKSPASGLSEVDKNLDQEQIELERKLLIEVNGSISYLIALSCISISGLLVLSALDASNEYITGIICALYSHFFLTAAMLIKRSHALFDNAYRRH